jgi:hypothetical protein
MGGIMKIFVKMIAVLLVLIMVGTMLVACKEEPEVNALEGKKICFVGNSFTWFGRCVIEKKQDVRKQEFRENDKGYFYQLCKANGVNVSVTNWTWGGHNLKDLFGGSCAAARGCDEVDHLAALKNRYFDYVVIQEGSGAPDFHEMLELVTQVFREANPDVKFIFMSHSSVHTSSNENYKEVRRSLKDLEQQGMMVADWGAMVVDVFSGKTMVPGATQTFDKNSFIVNWSKSDGYHPNMLTGYITAVWIYSLITGEKAAGQPYAFCTDKSLSAKFDAAAFAKKHYTYDGATTNMEAIFASEADMLGLQHLVDQYIAAKPSLSYE